MTIERWFIKGARYKWVAPSAVGDQTKDGAITDNPIPPPASTMTYDGLDDQITFPSFQNVSTLGFRKGLMIPHKWLNYILARTARMQMTTTDDVLTGFMSGCLITLWPEGGQTWVGHVGTIDGADKDKPPNSTVKATFLDKIRSLPLTDRPNIKGYSPANAWTPNEILAMMPKTKRAIRPQIVSLVTSDLDFYSIVMFALVAEQGNYVCGGIKKVDGMDYDALTVALQ
jgi:hypothetical protein